VANRTQTVPYQKGTMETPVIFCGDKYIDDRGSLSCTNAFDFAGVVRYYLVSNFEQGFIRAWHGHKKEGKYATCVQGSAVVCAVAVDNWESPSKNAQIHKYVLSADKPAVLWIPEGYANGAKTLEQGTKLMYFSTSTWEESRGDDYRFPYDYWNPWEVEKR